MPYRMVHAKARGADQRAQKPLAQTTSGLGFDIGEGNFEAEVPRVEACPATASSAPSWHLHLLQLVPLWRPHVKGGPHHHSERRTSALKLCVSIYLFNPL